MVVTAAAIEPVITGSASQIVVKITTGQVLHIPERAAKGIDPAGKTDRDVARRMLVAERIDTVAAIDRIASADPFDAVIPRTATEVIGRTVANEDIAQYAADQIFDAAETVASGIATAGATIPQIDPHGVAARAVERRIAASAANEAVAPVAAGQFVVAQPASEDVVTEITRKVIVKIAAGQIFNAYELIAGRMATAGSVQFQVHRDALRRRRITGGIPAEAADERVGAIAAFEHIVAVATVEHVVPGGAVQLIVMRAAGDVLDAGQCVTLGFTTAPALAVEPHRHARSRLGVSGRIDATATGKMVGAAAAFEYIVATTAIELVIEGVAAQDVVARAANNAFDAVECVAGGIAAAGTATGQVDRDRAAAGVAGRIVAQSAAQRVATVATQQHIVAGAAVEDIGAAVAGQLVVEIAAGQVFNAEQGVAGAIAAGGCRAEQIDIDRRSAVTVSGRVVAKTADQHIGAAAPFEQVIAITTVEPVDAGTASEGIGQGRAGQVFDVDVTVTFGTAASADARSQAGDDAGTGRGVSDRVDARTAGQCVFAVAAIERVVAGSAVETVVAGVAGEGVIAIAAEKVFDAGVAVDLCRADATDIGPQAGCDRSGCTGITGRVIAVATQQIIVASAALEDVVAAATFEPVVSGVANEGVIEGAAEQVFDTSDDIAFGITATAGGALSEIIEDHVDRHRAAGIAGGVSPGTTINRIGAATAGEQVVTTAAFEPVVAGAAIEAVVAGIAAQDIDTGAAEQDIVKGSAGDAFDAVVGIALGLAADAAACCQVDIDQLAAGAVIGDVETIAADQHIGPDATVEGVVADTAVKDVDAVIAVQAVIKATAEQIFDGHELVAGGVGAAVGQPAGQIDRDRTSRMHVRRRVIARAAIKLVTQAPAFEHVVAAISGQLVVEGRAGQVFDAVIGIAGGFAGITQRIHQADMHAGLRIGIAGRVAAGATEQRIGTAPAGQQVIAGAAVEPVVGSVAGEFIGIARTDQVFNVLQHVALGLAARPGCAGQAHAHRQYRCRIAGRVVALAALQDIRTQATGQQVIAGAAVEQVGVGVTGEHIVEDRADDGFDASERVALGIAATTLAAGQADHHGSRRVGIRRRIEAGTADERIGTATAFEHVIAGAAIEPVGVVVAA